MNENALVCPETGQQGTTTFHNDPRIELREKCDAPEEEIAEHEAKIDPD